jgi:hypothetical protein
VKLEIPRKFQVQFRRTFLKAVLSLPLSACRIPREGPESRLVRCGQTYFTREHAQYRRRRRRKKETKGGKIIYRHRNFNEESNKSTRTMLLQTLSLEHCSARSSHTPVTHSRISTDHPLPTPSSPSSPPPGYIGTSLVSSPQSSIMTSNTLTGTL